MKLILFYSYHLLIIVYGYKFHYSYKQLFNLTLLTMEIELSQFSYLDQYKIIKTLGVGYHAKVKLAECPNHKLVAIKRFKKETSDLGILQHELNILSKLHHQNLVNLIDVRPQAVYKRKCGFSYSCFAIVIEYAGGGQLFDFVALGGRFSPNVSRTYFYQMLAGIGYMHSKGYAHRDIKPQNILLTEDFNLKLADFGFSTLLQGKDHTGILHTRLGTQGYMAPQIQNRNYLGTQADIFSCGVILFIMYTATPPFEKSIPTDPKYKLIKDKQYEQFWSYHSKKKPEGLFTKEFKNLIERMLEFNPRDRITLQQIKKHPWYKGPIHHTQDLKKQFKIRKEKVDAELRRQKQQRQARKNQRDNTLTTEQTANLSGSQKSLSSAFETYQTQPNRYKIPPKLTIQKGDYIVKEEQNYFFQKILTLLNNQILIEDDDHEILFHPKCRLKQNKLELTLNYKYEKSESSIFMEITVSKTVEKDLCLSFKRISGNLLYYKKIVNFIRIKFIHHEVHTFHW